MFSNRFLGVQRFSLEDRTLQDSCSLHCFVSIHKCNLLVIHLAIVIRLSFCDCNSLVVRLAIITCLYFRNCNSLGWFAYLVIDDCCETVSLVICSVVVICLLFHDCNLFVIWLATAIQLFDPWLWFDRHLVCNCNLPFVLQLESDSPLSSGCYLSSVLQL